MSYSTCTTNDSISKSNAIFFVSEKEKNICFGHPFCVTIEAVIHHYNVLQKNFQPYVGLCIAQRPHVSELFASANKI